jgi:adenylate cyclase
LPRFPDKVSQFWIFGPSDPDVATLPGMALHALARDAEATLLGLLEEIRPGSVPLLAADSPPLSETSVLIRRALRNDADLAAQLLSRFETRTQPMAGFADDARARLEALARMYAGAESRYVNFYGPMRTVRTIPYHEILSADRDPAAFDLAGKVVFV